MKPYIDKFVCFCFGGSSAPAQSSSSNPNKKVKDKPDPGPFSVQQGFDDTRGTVMLDDPNAKQAKGSNVLTSV